MSVISQFLNSQVLAGYFNVSNIVNSYNSLKQYVKDYSISFKRFPELNEILDILENRINAQCLDDELINSNNAEVFELYFSYKAAQNRSNVIDDVITLLFLPIDGKIKSSHTSLDSILKSVTRLDFKDIETYNFKDYTFFKEIKESKWYKYGDYVILLANYFEKDFILRHLEGIESNNEDYLKVLTTFRTLSTLLLTNINIFVNNLDSNIKNILQSRYSFVRQYNDDTISIFCSDIIYKLMLEYVLHNPEKFIEVNERNKNDLSKI